MKKKILILGSSSFAGASMVNFLLKKKEYSMIGTYRKKKIKQYLPYLNNTNLKNFKNFKIDFTKNPQYLIKVLKRFKPTYIIDFASICMVNESWKNPDVYFKINVLYRSQIIKYLCNNTFLKKYIYISTPEVFGSSKKFISEKNGMFDPSTPYATSKLSTEMLLKNYSRHYNLPLIITRFSNFYGPGQPLYRLIPKIISCIDKHKKFPLQGSGKSKRNFIFSKDFCSGIYKTLKKGKIGQVYHFSGKTFYSVLEIIKLICELKSYKISKLLSKSKERVGQDTIYKLQSSFTIKSLSWNPVYSLKKGLNEVINYHKENFTNNSINENKYKDKNLA